MIEQKKTGDKNTSKDNSDFIVGRKNSFTGSKVISVLREIGIVGTTKYKK